jgi:hypothetical protein
MFLYSKESSNSAIDIENTEKEIIRCIEASKSISKPVFVAIKLSGLSTDEQLRQLEQDVNNLVSISSPRRTSFPASQIRRLLTRYEDLFNCLQRLSKAAERFNVHLVLDAELRFQGDVDSLPTSAILCSLLSSKHSPVWNTHQMYIP